MGIFDFLCCCYPKSEAEVPEIEIIQPPWVEKKVTFSEMMRESYKDPPNSPYINAKKIEERKTEFETYIKEKLEKK